MAEDRNRTGVVPGDDAEALSNTALKKVPLTLSVRKEYDYFSDFIAEFGEHIYPEGMFIPTQRPKPKGALVKVDFSTRDGFQILYATCEVVRCDEALPGMLSGMWVSFRVMDDTHKALIQKIYDERETSLHPSKPEEIESSPEKK